MSNQNIPEQELPLYAKAIIVYAIVATIYIYYLRNMPPTVTETPLCVLSSSVKPTTVQQVSTTTTTTAESPSFIEKITSFFSSRTSTNVSQQTKI